MSEPVQRRSVLQALALFASLPLLGPKGASAAESMRIGVIGAGSLGGTVGRLWVKAGHQVLFASRHPEELSAMARELGPRASAGTSAQAADFGDVILFAVPYRALTELGGQLQGALRGKVVLDSCNPSAAEYEAFVRETSVTSVGELSSRLLPNTRLVRAFSAVDATAVAASFSRASDKLGVPLAGDDAAAVQIGEQLVRDAGCEPVTVGNLKAATNFQRGSPAFRANTTVSELRRLIEMQNVQ
ncbi:NADPH-dependent F420 reductase [Peristeroidobacter soli]|uniref:NADPH-dependent F420 reductase n=1 Tax=Peristeroidobacter soli TaxID=2497877 RepID=UPI001C377B84|nr:NADPH-dependent F420 reductase [Peristeroidobacter soli]